MNMTDDYIKRIKDFLFEYVCLKDCNLKYDDNEFIKYAIKKLVKEGVFTVKELHKEALKSHFLIIPERFINKCVYGVI